MAAAAPAVVVVVVNAAATAAAACGARCGGGSSDGGGDGVSSTAIGSELWSGRVVRGGGRPRGGVKGRLGCASSHAGRAAAVPRERRTRGRTWRSRLMTSIAPSLVKRAP